MKTILLAEDDYEIAKLIKEYLKEFDYKVIWSSTGYEALEDFQNNDVDLVVLDIMMPELDGYGFLDRLRKFSNIPVIIISANTKTSYKVEGFNLGADDYLTKPFSLLELKIRIEYHLKNAGKTVNIEEENDIIYDGGLKYLKDTSQFFIKNEEIHLTQIEEKILLLLMKNPKKLFNKSEIYKIIWADDSELCNSTVTVHMKSLRQKLRENLKEPKLIETVWGKGYRFIGEKI